MAASEDDIFSRFRLLAPALPVPAPRELCAGTCAMFRASCLGYITLSKPAGIHKQCVSLSLQT